MHVHVAVKRVEETEKETETGEIMKWHSKCGKILTFGYIGWRVYSNILYCFWNFYINLKLLKNLKN